MGNAETPFQSPFCYDFDLIQHSWWSSNELLLQHHFTISRTTKYPLHDKVMNIVMINYAKLTSASLQKWNVSEWNPFVWGFIWRLDRFKWKLGLLFHRKTTYQNSTHSTEHKSCCLVQHAFIAKDITASFCQEIPGIHYPLFVLWRKHKKLCFKCHTVGYWWTSRFHLWIDQCFFSPPLHRYRFYLYFHLQIVKSTLPVVPLKSMYHKTIIN